jgi:hypothetical protein
LPPASVIRPPGDDATELRFIENGGEEMSDFEQPLHASEKLVAHRRPLEESGNAADEASQTSRTQPTRTGMSLLDLMLDPRSIQTLMGVSAGLLMLGLVLWLWSVGVFENPLVAAATLGGANVALLGAGIALVRGTHYTMAGRGCALLASALMPLNLWFYDAQGLIALDQGGHLWIPATLICLIYAATARLTRDPNFAYALVGGVALTGLLILADSQVARFYDMIAPPALLAVIGLISLHAERFFPSGAGPFSRGRFGASFANAGLAAVIAGEAILMVCHLGGIAYDAEAAKFRPFEWPALAEATRLNIATLSIALAGSYALIYRYFVVGRDRFTPSLVAGNLLWTGAIVAEMLAIPTTPGFFILLAGLIGLGMAVIGRISPASGRTSGDAFLTGQMLMLVAGIASAVLMVDKLIGGEGSFAMLRLLLPMAGLLGAGSLCAKEAGWRGGLIAAAVAQVGFVLLVLHQFSGLNFPQRVEILCVLAGVVHLALAHAGWSREDAQQRDPAVTYGFYAGSILVVVPLLLGLALTRLGAIDLQNPWGIGHEIAPLVAGLVLLAAGLLTKVRGTTIAGSATLLFYVLTLPCYVQLPEQLQTTAVYLMIGGGTFFTIALALSIYRDRLVTVAQQARKREGLFQFLTWR